MTDDLKPRPYDLSSASERKRLWRECDGYLRTCERHHHGTDFQGRKFARQALGQLVELGSAPDPLTERLAEALRTLVGHAEIAAVAPEAIGRPIVMAIDAPELDEARDALRAYGESLK